MHIANLIIGLGKPIAYFPGLKKLTGSTNATILLCQLIYWSDKTRDTDGWIYKITDEVEEETGLTYNEQKTAKQKLVEAGLIDAEYKRLDHSQRFRVCLDELMVQWNDLNDINPEQNTDIDAWLKGKKKEQEAKPQRHVRTREEILEQKNNGKNKDELDAIITYGTKAEIKAQHTERIKVDIEKKLKVLPRGKRWDEFIEFAYERETTTGETIGEFLKYALVNGFDPIYWTPNKMITLWPQAFVDAKSQKTTYDVEHYEEDDNEETVSVLSVMNKKPTEQKDN